MPRTGATSALVVTAFMALLQGCHPSFDVHVSSKSTVQGGGLVQNLVFGLGTGFSNFDIAQQQDFKNQGVSKSDVNSVKLKSMQLKVTSPAGATLDFLKSIEFSATSDGLPTVSVASISAIPAGATTVDLAVANVELKPYIVAPSMSVTTNANGHPPPQDTEIEASLVLDVEPKIF